MTSFAKALVAAQAATAGQHFPVSCLYMLATPIGNLADITLRALHVLELADCIACEDTRHTQQLLRLYGIDKSSRQLLAVHQHNEREAAQKVVALLQEGQRIAYVSDAGTPGISDPGAVLAQEVAAAGFRIMPLPGASSVVTAISAAALPVHAAQESGFVFAGFLPPKTKSRESAVARLQKEPRTVVLLEAPHRIADLAVSLAVLGDRVVTLARELTKQFEQIHTIPAHALQAWLAEDASRCKGEFVVLLHPLVQSDSDEDADVQQATRFLTTLLSEGLGVKSAAKITAELTGQPRNSLYAQALILQKNLQEQNDASIEE